MGQQSTSCKKYTYTQDMWHYLMSRYIMSRYMSSHYLMWRSSMLRTQEMSASLHDITLPNRKLLEATSAHFTYAGDSSHASWCYATGYHTTWSDTLDTWLYIKIEHNWTTLSHVFFLVYALEHVTYSRDWLRRVLQIPVLPWLLEHRSITALTSSTNLHNIFQATHLSL